MGQSHHRCFQCSNGLRHLARAPQPVVLIEVHPVEQGQRQVFPRPQDKGSTQALPISLPASDLYFLSSRARRSLAAKVSPSKVGCEGGGGATLPGG